MCDQVAEKQDDLVVAQEERLLLLRKLCQLQGEIDPPSFYAKSQLGNSGSPIPHSDTVTLKKSSKKRNSIDIPGNHRLNTLLLILMKK